MNMREPREARAPREARQPREAREPRAPREPLEWFKEAPDPLTEPPAGMDPESQVKRELSELEQGFRDRRDQEQARFEAATDAIYYFVVAFESGNQAAAMLEHFGIKPGAGDLFIDGRIIARNLGVELPASNLPKVRLKQDDRLRAMTRGEKGK
jgi:hypothetical protein